MHMLAACAAAVAANRYSERHARSVAVMKALGATTTLSRKVPAVICFCRVVQCGLWFAGRSVAGTT